MNQFTSNKSTVNIVFFLCILFSSLLRRIQFPIIDIGIHYLLLTVFSFLIIGFNFKYLPSVFRKHKVILTSLGILYLWMWICSFISLFPNTSIIYAIKYSTYLILFFAFLVLNNKNHKISLYSRIVLYFIAIISAIGFIEALAPDLWIFRLLKYPSFYPQIGSIMQNPNPFGVIVAIGLCLSIILEKQKKISKLELYISEFIFIPALAFSASRNAWLIFLFGLFLLLIYKILNIRQVIILISIWIFCVLLIPVSTYRVGLGNSKIFPLINLFATKTVETKVPSPAGTALSRLALWQTAISETIKRPITGIGVGVFAEHIGVKVIGRKGFNTHNIFFNVLVELGIPGLLLFNNFLWKIVSIAKVANPVTVIPITMFLASQIPDFFLYDYTFTTIEFYFLAAASNSLVRQKAGLSR
ncbi:MAG: O-antigen ligase family protein [Nostocaceae cyanobacterium]|nr:O-antigen ligase family protein [Nostocaceae cyanobacterium]